MEMDKEDGSLGSGEEKSNNKKIISLNNWLIIS
jgi:hypothetical protein